MPDAWSALAEYTEPIPSDAQVLLVSGTGGAKSTLAATMLLRVPSLVVLDDKGAMALPHSRLVELPPYNADEPERYYDTVKRALAWREGSSLAESNRVILRPYVLDVEDFDAHDQIFRAVFERRHTILWVDEIGATGATPQRSQRWLRAISSRGRTRGVGLWTLSQSAYGMFPAILRRNANLTIVGSLDPNDVADIPRPGIEIAETIPRKSGRFLVYVAGEREPYRMYHPIPDALKGWKAP